MICTIDRSPELLHRALVRRQCASRAQAHTCANTRAIKGGGEPPNTKLTAAAGISVLMVRAMYVVARFETVVSSGSGLGGDPAHMLGAPARQRETRKFPTERPDERCAACLRPTTDLAQRKRSRAALLSKQASLLAACTSRHSRCTGLAGAARCRGCHARELWLPGVDTSMSALRAFGR